MAFETWAAFVVTTVILLIVPGPTVLLAVSYALGQGRRAALPVAIGVACADLTAMTLSMLGVGMLLKTSATLFAAVKWAGAAYLVWLGLKLWRAGGTLHAPPRNDSASALRMAAHAWLVTCLNPKAITFFVAFLPQFVNAQAGLLPQMAVLAATFSTLSFLNSMSYGLAASSARGFALSGRAQQVLNKAGGALLIGGGVAAAAVDAAPSLANGAKAPPAIP